MTEEDGVKEGAASPGIASGESVKTRIGDISLPPRARQVFLWILLLLCFLAAFQLYFTVQGIISTWVNEPYIPFANAAFYLVVIVGSIFIIRQWLVSK